MTPACPLPHGARCWAYLRDSGGAGQERSAEQQLAEAQAYCAEHALELLSHGVYIDAASGGSVDGRAQFLAMIRELRRLAPERGPRDPEAPAGVLYWDLKRFARNQDDGAYYSADLRRRGYTLVSLSDEIPGGELAPVFEALFRWKAQQDLEDLSKDVKRGHRAQLLATGADGYLHLWPGKAPRGYVREAYEWGSHRSGKPRTTGRLAPGPELALVRRAFGMRAAGYSYGDIHDELGLFKNLTDYRRLLRNPFYIGTLRYGDLVVEDWIEPAVSRETWDAVQARRRVLRPPREGTSDFALTGFARCENGHPLVGAGDTRTLAGGRVRRYRYYVCTRWKNNRECRGGGIDADRLERAAYDALAGEALTPPRVRALLAGREDAGRDHALRRRVDERAARLRELDQAIGRLVAAVEAGGPIPALVGQLQARQGERDRARGELAAAERQLRALAGRPEQEAQLVEDFCLNVGWALGAGEVAVIRRLLEALEVRIQMHDGRQGGEISYRLPAELGAVAGAVSFEL